LIHGEEEEMRNAALFIPVFLLFACAPGVVPSAAPLPSLTATSTETITPSPAPTLTPTPFPGGLCDNPLVPLALGNQWRYRATTTNGVFEYALSALERKDARTITTIVGFNDIRNNQSVREQVICMEGAIENYPLFVMDMLFADHLNKIFNTYHDTGIYAPRHQTFAENNWMLTWEADYLTEDSATITNPAGGPDLVVLQSSPMHLSFAMDGTREPVNVPAGEYPQAYKVSHVFDLTVTITLPTGGAGGNLTLYTTQWYEPYVGLVRAQLDSATLRTGGQEFDVPLQSIVELIEFTPGK
jgi:hypothetical protein